MSAHKEIKADAIPPTEPTEVTGTKPAQSNTVDAAGSPATDTQDIASNESVAESEAAQTRESSPAEEGEIQEDTTEYRWCKCFLPPAQHPHGQDHYFMHFDTRQTQWQEPNEPYWVWDALRQTVHASGLQQPSNREHPATSAPPSSEPEPEGERYNPAIHGNYDPTAPYAKRYEDKRRAQVEEEVYGPSVRARQSTGYAAVGAFNRFSGAFQTSDKSADRHNDYNKSGRQMRNFFDVDAAANVHGGKSLKDERRQAKISKKELHALKKKKREKKEKKRLDFYKS